MTQEELNDALIKAAYEQDADADDVKELLNQGAEINCTDGSLGQTPLMFAIQGLNPKVVKILLELGAKIDLKDNVNNTASSLARGSSMVESMVFRSNPKSEKALEFLDAAKVADSLINKGKFVVSSGLELADGLQKLIGERVYSLAAEKFKNANDIKSFLKNIRSIKELPAALKDMLQDVLSCLYLEKKSVDIAQEGEEVEDGLTAINNDNIKKQKKLNQDLFVAIAINNKDEILNLIDQGADVNDVEEHNTTPLQAAIFALNDEVFELLLKNNADINKSSKNGYNVLHRALKKKNHSLVEFLVKLGANVDCNGPNELTPLHISIIQEDHLSFNIIIKNTKNINAKDIQGNTAIQHAVKKGDLYVVSEIINHGADINLEDNRGVSPLSNATLSDDNEMIKLLLSSQGVDINTLLIKQVNDLISTRLTKLIEINSENAIEVKTFIKNILKIKNLSSSLRLELKEKLKTLYIVSKSIELKEGCAGPEIILLSNSGTSEEDVTDVIGDDNNIDYDAC